MKKISEVLCFANLLSVCFKGAPGGAVVKKVLLPRQDLQVLPLGEEDLLK